MRTGTWPATLVLVMSIGWGCTDGAPENQVVCGDQVCSDGEAGSCLADCPPVCGDDVCADTESVMTCAADCPAVCGDNACTHQETASSCARDCPARCGDGTCTGNEWVVTCQGDCPPTCGDNVCSAGETAALCANDCPPSCGDNRCTHNETVASCPADCPAICGDTVCSPTETCAVCALDCGVCLPSTVDITLFGALILPAMNDGRTWDGPDLSPEQVDVLAELATTLAGQPQYSDVAGFLANLAISTWMPPDPFGVAELAWNGTYDPALNISVATIDNNAEDTLSPQWPGPPFPGWINVPTGSTLRVRLTLQDEDIAFDDMIGTVELNEADLRAAFNDGGVANVAVHGQGAQQILFVTLSVAASVPPACSGDCAAGVYSACSCGAADPCGWANDGACDSYCTANFPADHFDDFGDCAAACASDCQALVYSACTCSSVDPCGWAGDGVCDAACAQSFPADHFNDGADCP